MNYQSNFDISIDVSRTIIPADILAYYRYLKLFVFAGFLASTTFMVIFGEQGLLVLSDTEERLAEARIDAGQLKKQNKELRLKLRRLKSRPEEVALLAGEIFNQTKDGSTLYVFSSEE